MDYSSPFEFSAVRNALLRRAGPGAFERIAPLLESVALRPGWLSESAPEVGGEIFFIETGVVIVTTAGEDEAMRVGVGVIGPEGACAPNGALGRRGELAYLLPGPVTALCLRASDLDQRSAELPTLTTALQDSFWDVYEQVARSAACNARHRLAGRLARWLLMLDERMAGGPVTGTHETLAHVLGVRRAGVSTALKGLERAGLVDQSWGCIAVRDRAGLAGVSCGCEAAPRAGFHAEEALPV